MDNVSYKGLTATAPTRVGVYGFLQVHTVLAEGRAATALILISIGDQSWASVWLSVRHCPLLSPFSRAAVFELELLRLHAALGSGLIRSVLDT